MTNDDLASSADRGKKPWVLFLCTGNYYRSRFAEALWEHLERAEPTGWSADSRGLAAFDLGNIGPISPHALRGLRLRGVHCATPIRPPRQVSEDDFESAGHVVAVSAAEHRSMIQAGFPGRLDTIEYWDVEDIGFCPIDVALENLDTRVRELRQRLARKGDG